MVKALVLFHSQEHGVTPPDAEAVAAGLKRSRLRGYLFNTNDARFNIRDILNMIVLPSGSPDYFSYIAGGLKMFLDTTTYPCMKPGWLE